MPVMPSDVPQVLEAVMKTVYLQELANLKPDYARVCKQVNTTQETQDYGWMGTPPAIREFVDERVAKGLAVAGMKITDKTWEGTIAVSRRELENNQYGVIQERVRMLAQRMAQGIDELAFTMLYYHCKTATYGYSFDQYDKDGNIRTDATMTFSDTDHSYPPPAEYTTSQSNYGTAALSASAVFADYGAMMTWKDDRGKIIPYKPDLLMVAPALYETALQIVTPLSLPVASATAYANVSSRLGLDVMVVPYWAANASYAGSWALAKTDGIEKPLILQVFTPAANGQLFEFSALEGNSDNGFMRDVFYYGIRGRWNLGYGDWRTYYFESHT